MWKISPVFIALSLTCVAPALLAVEPIPESQQGPLVLKLLDAYHGTRPAGQPKKLHVIYFTPSDRNPEPRYRERLEAILEDIRAFYREGMKQAGLGPETFDLARDAQGEWILHFVKGREVENNYHKPDSDKISGECRPVLEAAGISMEQETVLIMCNMATWDVKAKTFRNTHSPYYGMWTQTNGMCFAIDTIIQNLDDIAKKEPILDDDQYGKMSLGKFNTIFIGGIAHELGHAFALPHCGERWDEKPRGTSLMGIGNHTYRDERRGESPGSFLAMASAMKLAARPLFSKSDLDMTLAPQLETNEFHLSTNVSRSDLAGRKGGLRVEGIVKGTPPVYGVIAYFDSLHDGGYRAPTATSVPDADGRFALEVSDLKSCVLGDLRIEYCHANGAISESHAPFGVTPDGTVDLEQAKTIEALEPLIKAVLQEDRSVARLELASIEKSSAPELGKTVARKLMASLQDEPKPIPARVPPEVTQLPLGDAQPEVAKVGWAKPAANRIPQNKQIEAPWLESGKIYATGLFAHAPSRYVYDLGGKWKSLRGEAGLHTLQQPYGSVVFVIKTDGKEAFRSPVVRRSAKPSYEVNVMGVKTLELIVEDAGDGNGNDWGLWLDPMLAR